MMISFDVTCLFTNVLLTYVINCILDRMYPVCPENCPHLPTAKKCTEYQSREASNSHIENALHLRQEDVRTAQWCHDGRTFVPVQPDANVPDIHATLNGFHPSIQFTFEKEAGKSLRRLDVRVTRSPERHTFETITYRKPVVTGLMINCHSFVPLQCKEASIDNMDHRTPSLTALLTGR